MIPQHLKMFVILHCCWRQTDALLIVVFYAIYEEGTQDEKIQYYQIPSWDNKIYDMGFVIPHQTNAGLSKNFGLLTYLLHAAESFLRS